MIYRALITDLDGTAVKMTSDGEEIDAATRQAVASGIVAGKFIACATGRDWAVARPVIEYPGLVAPCIVEGGTRIVDPRNGSTLWAKSLDNGAARQILKIFHSEATSGKVMHSTNLTLRPLNIVGDITHSESFVYLLGVHEREADRIRTRINASNYAVAHLTPSWDGNGLIDVHVTHPEATKEHAMLMWHKIVGITRSETIGMGDSGNDIPIFKAAGLKVAVGNATPELKVLADKIGPDVEDNALEYVINTFLMP
jgi:HAD superfamily hydrolase (TIGR01484 family)